MTFCFIYIIKLYYRPYGGNVLNYVIKTTKMDVLQISILIVFFVIDNTTCKFVYAEHFFCLIVYIYYYVHNHV